MAQKITAMKRKRVLAAIGALALSAVATNSHAYGISYISAYTPCVNYSAGVARADLIGSIPGWTVEEIHWAYLYPPNVRQQSVGMDQARLAKLWLAIQSSSGIL